MNTQRTPGHWRIGDAGLTVFGPHNGNLSPETIARTRNRANARLIAAAPDLLQALAEMLAIYGDNAQYDDSEDQCEVSAIDAARAAIAKATGEA